MLGDRGEARDVGEERRHYPFLHSQPLDEIWILGQVFHDLGVQVVPEDTLHGLRFCFPKLAVQMDHPPCLPCYQHHGGGQRRAPHSPRQRRDSGPVAFRSCGPHASDGKHHDETHESKRSSQERIRRLHPQVSTINGHTSIVRCMPLILSLKPRPCKDSLCPSRTYVPRLCVPRRTLDGCPRG